MKRKKNQKENCADKACGKLFFCFSSRLKKIGREREREREISNTDSIVEGRRRRKCPERDFTNNLPLSFSLRLFCGQEPFLSRSEKE